MVEALAEALELKVMDLDEEKIGQEKFGAMVHRPEKTIEHLQWCDIALVTGTTLVNNTIVSI